MRRPPRGAWSLPTRICTPPHHHAHPSHSGRFWRGGWSISRTWPTISNCRRPRGTSHGRGPGRPPASRDISRKGAVAIPLLRDGMVIGSIGLGAKEVGSFADSEIELLQTFAEQAVIAITSAHTYRELQRRTSDLEESLEYQTATSDVLQV